VALGSAALKHLSDSVPVLSEGSLGRELAYASLLLLQVVAQRALARIVNVHSYVGSERDEVAAGLEDCAIRKDSLIEDTLFVGQSLRDASGPVVNVAGNVLNLYANCGA